MKKTALRNYWEVTTEELIAFFKRWEFGELTILPSNYICRVEIENMLIHGNMLIDYVAYVEDEAWDELKKIEKENPVIFTFEDCIWDWEKYGDGYKLSLCDDAKESIMNAIDELNIDPETLE